MYIHEPLTDILNCEHLNKKARNKQQKRYKQGRSTK